MSCRNHYLYYFVGMHYTCRNWDFRLIFFYSDYLFIVYTLYSNKFYLFKFKKDFYPIIKSIFIGRVIYNYLAHISNPLFFHNKIVLDRNYINLMHLLIKPDGLAKSVIFETNNCPSVLKLYCDYSLQN